jgi:hypothetical protein
LVWHAFGVAALVVAAELGAAQAFRLIRWDDDFGSGIVGSWPALLTWVGFSYVIAVVAGAAVGRRAVRRPTRPDGVVARTLAALAASAGAGAAVILVWLPSGDVRAPATVDPRLVVTLTASAGILVGAMVALATLSVAPLAGSVSVTVVWVWLVAIASALADTASGSARSAPRLAVVDAPGLVPVDQWWTGPSLMIGMAVVLGALVALVARWGGGSRPWIAMSGLAGPLVVAAAYLLAGPGTADPGQRDAYYASLIAVAAGLFASALIAAPSPRTPAKSPTPATRRPAVNPSVDAGATDDTTALDARPDTGWFDAEPHHEPTDHYRERVPDARAAEPQSYASLASYPDESYPDESYPDESYPGESYAGKSFPVGSHVGGEPEPTDPALPYQTDQQVMGQPVRQFDGEYVEWVSELGQTENTHRGGRHR